MDKNNLPRNMETITTDISTGMSEDTSDLANRTSIRTSEVFRIDSVEFSISESQNNIMTIVRTDDEYVHSGDFLIDSKGKEREILLATFRKLYGLTLSVDYDRSSDVYILKPCHPLFDVSKEYELTLIKNLKEEQKPEWYLYFLELEHGKYYVGKSKDPLTRIDEHKSASGADWTKVHKPIKVINVIPMINDFDEDMQTLKLMREQGVDNVRGGSFCKFNLSQEDLTMIRKMINGSKDACYACGSMDHFIDRCPQKRAFGKRYLYDRTQSVVPTVWDTKSMRDARDARFGFNGRFRSDTSDYSHRDPLVCYVCNKSGHIARECRSVRRLDGSLIEDRYTTQRQD
ncbi:GIY-YIG nuclease [Yasminevirus sp. GU-2018]|uniref:GIY-YIG nuclease n=1 Tax=Yasminevirus sp. GU-2018 TaxID=2420051 RepID=A0A5K0U8J4_9VIRU|nr:GIY-YIG nuclease [Yasminevirus sp. GU-2018]